MYKIKKSLKPSSNARENKLSWPWHDCDNAK